MEKVLFNLLSNAFKYTGDEGRISVSLWRDDELQQVVLEVKDSGIGPRRPVEPHF
jgi:signal transduction histidine kinase